MIDKWIRENSKFNYDKNGELAKSGEINELILKFYDLIYLHSCSLLFYCLTC